MLLFALLACCCFCCFCWLLLLLFCWLAAGCCCWCCCGCCCFCCCLVVGLRLLRLLARWGAGGTREKGVSDVLCFFASILCTFERQRYSSLSLLTLCFRLYRRAGWLLLKAKTTSCVHPLFFSFLSRASQERSNLCNLSAASSASTGSAAAPHFNASLIKLPPLLLLQPPLRLPLHAPN